MTAHMDISWGKKVDPETLSLLSTATRNFTGNFYDTLTCGSYKAIDFPTSFFCIELVSLHIFMTGVVMFFQENWAAAVFPVRVKFQIYYRIDTRVSRFDSQRHH